MFWAELYLFEEILEAESYRSATSVEPANHLEVIRTLELILSATFKNCMLRLSVNASS